MKEAVVINLDRAEDRMKSFAEAWRDIADFERLAGIDRRILDGLKIPHRRWKHPMRSGEIRCLISHRSVWQKALDCGLDGLTIFEDDAVPVRRDRLEDVIAAVRKEHPAADAILLNHSSGFLEKRKPEVSPTFQLARDGVAMRTGSRPPA